MRILSMHPRGTSRVLLHAIKSYDMGPSRFTSHPRGRCAADFYRPKKNPSPWPGSNPQPLGPVASTLTTTPTRRTIHCQLKGRQQFSLFSCILSTRPRAHVPTCFMTSLSATLIRVVRSLFSVHKRDSPSC
jgi:hypothetical protein